MGHLHRHHEFSLATDLQVCTSATHTSLWQRGSSKKTNGLRCQYFPEGTDLSVHTRDHLEAVAAELNGRQRKTLGWETPPERFATLLDTNH